MPRSYLAGISAGVVLLVAFGALWAQAPKKTSKGVEPKTAKGVEHAEHNAGLQACAKACSDCQRACDTCSTHCAHLVHGGNADHITTLMTCQDCADACAAAAHITARGGPFSGTICDACATICGDCAKQCEKFPDDKEMTACAEECRKCEKACKEMAKHAGHKQ